MVYTETGTRMRPPVHPDPQQSRALVGHLLRTLLHGRRHVHLFIVVFFQSTNNIFYNKSVLLVEADRKVMGVECPF